MPADPNEENVLHEANKQLAAQVGSLTAQKLRLSGWLVKALLALGGQVEISGDVMLSEYHLKSLHHCKSVIDERSGHSASCVDRLEVHSGSVEACQDAECVRLRALVQSGPGTFTERTIRRAQVEPPQPPPTAPGDMVASERMNQLERWQHPERN